MSLIRKTPKRPLRVYLSNMDERFKEDTNTSSNFKSYLPTIWAMVVHEDSRIGEVDVMLQKEDLAASETVEAFKKFGFIVKDIKVDMVIEKSFLGFKWSKI